MDNQAPSWTIWAELSTIVLASTSIYQGMIAGRWELAGLLLVCSLCAAAAAIRGNRQ